MNPCTAILFIMLSVFNVNSARILNEKIVQNTTEYTNLAWKAVTTINTQTWNSGTYCSVPIKVLSAKTQVVAGTKTTLQVLFGESSCRKINLQAIEVNANNCQITRGGYRAIYTIIIWEKPWENFEQITATKVRDVTADEIF